MTFSIAARCAETGMLGIAVSSSSPAVAARCAYARAQIGAVGSQNITDPTLGPRLLDLMALGATAPEAARIVRGLDSQGMRTGLTISGIAHAVVLLWSVLVFVIKPYKAESESMPVDIISESQFSQLTAGSKNAPKTETETAEALAG